ncbi:MAG: bifunctional 4-hydroxy-2-oxoglutarate aldolase/2-dehydro-3-deoxy-phosphogluconate aldolase [Bacteroidales bacterium]|jgi:2-dehydro-3-deoxyphosphogluconate aldolase/(4S)-4-hydroxy-2-oxoglutarate aldolase|nr:bifunctional 4-hydroxy-2-oxoglutarate aldolase/2-dehydro-3-deoxy-phosphogluconate aldolase [Bacteroidales bacterium]
MARFTRIEVAVKMKESGIVPVFYHPDAEVVGQVLKACYDGGIRVFEFTNRGDFAHEVFSGAVKRAVREFPEMILGIGSVVDGGTASLYIQLGANFIVSPVLKEDIAMVCNRRKIAWIPGCGSLNDISRAEELGAEVVKIFPGSSVGGPPFVAAVKGPCPWTSIMPTGGVEATEENLKAWFDAGVTCVGMGSNLFPKDLIAAGQWDAITRKIKDVLDILKKVRK